MQLKLYSRKEFQRNSISYNDDDKGYLCNIYEYEWYWTLITVIITTATICIFIKIVHWLLYTESKQEEQPSQATLEEQPSQVTPEEQPIPPQATPEEQPLPPQSTLEEQPPQATSEEQPPQATSKEQQITQDKKKKREEKQKKKDIKKAFFWAFGFVVSVINLIDLYLLVVETQYYTKLQRSSLTNDTIINDFEPDVNIEPHKATKILQIILGLLIFLISGITGVICSFKCESLPKHFLAYLCKPICWCHPAIVYFVQFGNIFLFAYLLGSNILPTFFLMFVAAIETISLLVFSIALVSSVVMGMALIILYIDEYKNIYISKLQAGTVISLIMYSTIVLALLSLIIAFLLILSSANVNDASSKFVSIFIAAGSASFSLLAGSQVKNKLFAQGQVFSISQGNNKASNLPSSPTNKRSNTKFEKPSNRKSKSCPANDDLLIPLLEITTETT